MHVFNGSNEKIDAIQNNGYTFSSSSTSNSGAFSTDFKTIVDSIPKDVKGIAVFLILAVFINMTFGGDFLFKFLILVFAGMLIFNADKIKKF